MRLTPTPPQARLARRARERARRPRRLHRPAAERRARARRARCHADAPMQRAPQPSALAPRGSRSRRASPAAAGSGHLHRRSAATRSARSPRGYGLRTADVLALNGLGWRSIIHPGQVLRLAGTAAAAPAPGSRRPRLRAGRGIRHLHRPAAATPSARIAKRHGVTTQAVLAANGSAGRRSSTPARRSRSRAPRRPRPPRRRRAAPAPAPPRPPRRPRHATPSRPATPSASIAAAPRRHDAGACSTPTA